MRARRFNKMHEIVTINTDCDLMQTHMPITKYKAVKTNKTILLQNILNQSRKTELRNLITSTKPTTSHLNLNLN